MNWLFIVAFLKANKLTFHFSTTVILKLRQSLLWFRHRNLSCFKLAQFTVKITRAPSDLPLTAEPTV